MERCGTSALNATRCNPTRLHSKHSMGLWEYRSSKVSVMKVLALDTHHGMGFSLHAVVVRFINDIMRTCLLVWVICCCCDGQYASPVVAHHEKLEIEMPRRHPEDRQDDLLSLVHGPYTRRVYGIRVKARMFARMQFQRRAMCNVLCGVRIMQLRPRRPCS
jgi:hypothetical protein